MVAPATHDSAAIAAANEKLAYYVLSLYWRLIPAGSGFDEDDLLQEVRIAIWSAAKNWRIDGGASMSTFAMPQFKRAAILALRKARRRGFSINGLNGSGEKGTPNVFNDSCLPTDLWTERSSSRSMGRITEQVPDHRTGRDQSSGWSEKQWGNFFSVLMAQERQIIRMLFVEGLAPHEVMAKTGLSEGRVSHIKRAAINRIKEAFPDKTRLLAAIGE